jgi:hypothetical protein
MNPVEELGQMGRGHGGRTEAPLPHQRCCVAMDRSPGGRNHLSLRGRVRMDMEQGERKWMRRPLATQG